MNTVRLCQAVFAARRMWVVSISSIFLTAAIFTAARADNAAWIRTAGNGPWSAAATWDGGKIPSHGARVHVRQGHTVVYDVNSDQALRAVYVAGTLTFATDKDTRLDVGVLKIESGDEPTEEGFDCDAHIEELAPNAIRPALLVGTPDRPVAAGHTARIRLVYFEGQNKQSCPALVCCGGQMDLHGAPLGRTWVKLGATAAKGVDAVTVAEPVVGWRVGDRVIVTSTTLSYDIGGGENDYQTEERLVAAIDGTKVTLDKPLEHEHRGEGEYRAEIANLSRNVVVESGDPEGERGHTMYHRGSAGSISYAEFRHLGKRDVLGRYSLHYHLVGNSMRGSSVVGASIWDSHNRWLTIHGTNYLVVRDCVGFRSVGHGFYLEDGTEVQNILDRNLAVQSYRGKRLPKQVLPFDQNEGSGFWWANSYNTFTRNVTCENHQYGYRFQATESSNFKVTLPVQRADGTVEPVDIRTLPFVRFDSNEAHCDGLYGVNIGEGVNHVGPDARHPLVLRNTKIWEIHYAFRPQSPSLMVENLQIHNSIYGVYHPNYERHVYRNVSITRSDNGGDAEPFNRGHDDASVQVGSLTVDGLIFAGHRYSGMPLLQISDHNPSGTAETHLRNVQVLDRKDKNRRALVNLGGGGRPQPKTPTSVPVFVHDYYGAGRHAKVVSSRSGEVRSEDSPNYKSDPPLTGDESRVMEVSNVKFPQLLDPVDDAPPATVITRVSPTSDGWLVRGSAADNGEIRSVTVNGLAVSSLADNFAEWEIKLTKGAANQGEITATATDAAGNQEKLLHSVRLK